MCKSRRSTGMALVILAATEMLALAGRARGQMIDQTQAPNAALDGIAKSLTEEIGTGRGDWNTPGSASFLIDRDPYRAVRRGREIFQRKFTRAENQGPAVQDGIGDINTVIAIGAILVGVIALMGAGRREPSRAASGRSADAARGEVTPGIAHADVDTCDLQLD